MAGRQPLDRDRRRAVEPLLDRALDLPAEELEAWLSTLRAEQPELAADLEGLLADQEALRKEGFLEDGAFLRAPETVGRYRLLHPLGEGGMGIVYLAEQTAPIQREVALKLIRPGMDSRRVLARFDAERQALARMDHPFVSKVLDAGSTEDGRPFFVMEYVPGDRITHHCDREALTTAERLTLFLQVCDGVQHAHQRAIIHRDLKPSNVLVSLHDGVAVPKIIDFGVAKATERALTEGTLYTEAGALIGTLDSMSPEQTDPASGDVDTRTDVYALGVMLYELLAGVPPFDPRALREASLDTILRTIREVEPPKPSARLGALPAEQSEAIAKRRGVDLPTLRRQLAGELDWIVMKAIEKDRGRRYGSPAELAADVKRFLRHEPVLAGAPSQAYRVRKFVRRHRFGTATAALAALALLGFAAAMAVQAHRISREAEAKQRVADFLTELFQVSDPERTSGGQPTLRELLDRGAARVRGSLAEDPGLRAELLATMGNVYSNLGLYPEAEAILSETLEARRRLLGSEDPIALRSAHDLARLRARQGRWAEAEALHRETLRVRERTLGRDHPDTLRSQSDLARIVAQRGRHAEGVTLGEDALERQRRVLGPDHRDTLTSMAHLAWTYQVLGRNADSERLYREVLETRARVLGPEHPDTLVARTQLAYSIQALGRYAEAESLHRGTIDIQTRVLGPEHPDTLRSRTNLARVLADERKHAEAEVLMRRNVEVQRRLLGPEHWDTLAAMNCLAIALNGLGRHEEAARLHGEILETDRRVFGEEHPNTLWAMTNLALVWNAQGRHADAERLLRQTLEIRTRVFGAEHPDTLNSMYNLVLPLASQGKYAEAIALSRKTIALQTRVLGPQHPKTVRSLYNLACLLETDGDRSQALATLREAAARGFANVGLLERDSDLRGLRADPAYGEILAAARRNQEREARDLPLPHS